MRSRRNRPAPRGAKRPFYVLNATLDTAAFGDRATWQHRPDRARAQGGWLYGRGAADDKAGVMAHVGALRALVEAVALATVTVVARA